MRRVVIFVVILIVGVLLLLKCGNLNNKVKESSTNIPAAVISEPAKDTVYVVKVVPQLDTIYKTKYITRANARLAAHRTQVAINDQATAHHETERQHRVTYKGRGGVTGPQRDG